MVLKCGVYFHEMARLNLRISLRRLFPFSESYPIARDQKSF